MIKYFAFLFLFTTTCFGQFGGLDLPVVTQPVNDFEEILSAGEEEELRILINDLHKQKELSVVIVSVNSIEPFETIFDYSLALANRNSAGEIFIVVCAANRMIQIQNHDSVTGKLTDFESERIIDQYILSEFKKGNYFEGLLSGILEIRKEF